ncbi:ribbon-helix-helix protein, CopG family [Candidatus Bathyarchaeota archaeon]|nr:ribbon-helix-helix protein, CopG family [Candidatus Bathyarchaeota archaeon]
MQIVTVNLPSVYIDAIAKLTGKGKYPSRSEAIRVALRSFLKDELEMVKFLLELSDRTKAFKKQKEDRNKPGKIDMRSIRAGWEN